MRIGESPTVFELCLWQSRSDRSLRMVVGRELKSKGLTMMEWLLLSCVDLAGNSGLSMSGIASALDVTLPQVTALITTLVKQRFVRQKTQRSDRRSRHVLITAKGRLTLNDANAKITAIVTKWLDGLSEEQLANYTETLEYLAHMSTPESQESQ